MYFLLRSKMQFLWDILPPWLAPIDIISMRMVCSNIRKHIASKWICKMLHNVILSKLQNCGFPDPYAFVKQLNHCQLVLSGSFLLQCLFNENWPSLRCSVYADKNTCSFTSMLGFDLNLRIFQNSIFNHHEFDCKKISYDGVCLHIFSYTSIINRVAFFDICSFANTNTWNEIVDPKIAKYRMRDFRIQLECRACDNACYRCAPFIYEDVTDNDDDPQKTCYDDVIFTMERFKKLCSIKRRTEKRQQRLIKRKNKF